MAISLTLANLKKKIAYDRFRIYVFTRFVKQGGSWSPDLFVESAKNRQHDMKILYVHCNKSFQWVLTGFTF
jgi:hypothetical protein